MNSITVFLLAVLGVAIIVMTVIATLFVQEHWETIWKIAVGGAILIIIGILMWSNRNNRRGGGF